MVLPAYIRPLLAFFVVALIVGIAVVVLRSSPQGSTPVISVDQQLPKNIDVAIKKARFAEIQNGLVVWELVAERVNYDRSGNIAYLSDIRMEFQHTRFQGAVIVSADNGEYNGLTKIVRLNGDVHLETEDGASFETSSIIYNGVNAKFSTADPVIFRQQGLHLTALGMDLEVKNQRAHFTSLVKATINQN